MYTLPPFMDAVLSEERQLNGWEYSRWEFSGWEFSRGRFSWVEFDGANFPGGNFSGGNFPRTIFLESMTEIVFNEVTNL